MQTAQVNPDTLFFDILCSGEPQHFDSKLRIFNLRDYESVARELFDYLLRGGNYTIKNSWLNKKVKDAKGKPTNLNNTNLTVNKNAINEFLVMFQGDDYRIAKTPVQKIKSLDLIVVNDLVEFALYPILVFLSYWTPEKGYASHDFSKLQAANDYPSTFYHIHFSTDADAFCGVIREAIKGTDTPKFDFAITFDYYLWFFRCVFTCYDVFPNDFDIGCSYCHAELDSLRYIPGDKLGDCAKCLQNSVDAVFYNKNSFGFHSVCVPQTFLKQGGNPAFTAYLLKIRNTNDPKDAWIVKQLSSPLNSPQKTSGPLDTAVSMVGAAIDAVSNKAKAAMAPTDTTTVVKTAPTGASAVVETTFMDKLKEFKDKLFGDEKKMMTLIITCMAGTAIMTAAAWYVHMERLKSHYKKISREGKFYYEAFEARSETNILLNLIQFMTGAATAAGAMAYMIDVSDKSIIDWTLKAFSALRGTLYKGTVNVKELKKELKAERNRLAVISQDPNVSLGENVIAREELAKIDSMIKDLLQNGDISWELRWFLFKTRIVATIHDTPWETIAITASFFFFGLTIFFGIGYWMGGNKYLKTEIRNIKYALDKNTRAFRKKVAGFLWQEDKIRPLAHRLINLKYLDRLPESRRRNRRGDDNEFREDWDQKYPGHDVVDEYDREWVPDWDEDYQKSFISLRDYIDERDDLDDHVRSLYEDYVALLRYREHDFDKYTSGAGDWEDRYEDYDKFQDQLDDDIADKYEKLIQALKPKGKSKRPRKEVDDNLGDKPTEKLVENVSNPEISTSVTALPYNVISQIPLKLRVTASGYDIKSSNASKVSITEPKSLAGTYLLLCTHQILTSPQLVGTDTNGVLRTWDLPTDKKAYLYPFKEKDIALYNWKNFTNSPMAKTLHLRPLQLYEKAYHGPLTMISWNPLSDSIELNSVTPNTWSTVDQKVPHNSSTGNGWSGSPLIHSVSNQLKIEFMHGGTFGSGEFPNYCYKFVVDTPSAEVNNSQQANPKNVQKNKGKNKQNKNNSKPNKPEADVVSQTTKSTTTTVVSEDGRTATFDTDHRDVVITGKIPDDQAFRVEGK
nr:nonstructural polyprotein 1a [Stellavirales sp.]